MIYTQFGKTGKKVSKLGFGGMRFRPQDYKGGDFQICADVMLRAYELGVNYFDTAPNYCHDKSEEIFGLALSQMKGNGDFYCTTKNGIGVTGDKTSDQFLTRLDRSMKRMGVDKIHFMHLWCVLSYEEFKLFMVKDGLYDGALKAKEMGLIDHIVLSTHASGADISRILRETPFDGVLLGYNATNFPYRREGLATAKELNLGVVTMNPLGGGIIPQNPDFYSFLKKDDEFSVAQSALRFNASHPEITVTLSGMSTIAEVEENVRAMNNLHTITEADKDAIAGHLSGGLNALCTGCGYCDACPQDINIPQLMDCYNQFILTKDKKQIDNRAAFHWRMDKSQAQRCIECGYCEEKCTQKLPIIDRLKQI